MKRVNFSSDGKLVGVDGKVVGNRGKPRVENFQRQSDFSKDYNTERDFKEENGNLITSEDLDFLKEEKPEVEDIFEKSFWSLYDKGKALEPLRFSNGKTQEDVVKEVVPEVTHCIYSSLLL